MLTTTHGPEAARDDWCPGPRDNVWLKPTYGCQDDGISCIEDLPRTLNGKPIGGAEFKWPVWMHPRIGDDEPRCHLRL